MRVVVTRPVAEGRAWCAALRERGVDAVAVPLIATAALAPGERSVLDDAWRRLPRLRVAMFVSAAAVQHFFDAAPAGSAWPDGLRAWSPGPGTSAVLRARGVPPEAIDAPAADAAQLDSESLWAAAGGRIAPGDAVLIVRGAQHDQDDPAGSGHGRAWMAERLAAAGATVSIVAAYRRGPPVWNAADIAHATGLAARDTTWIFSNSEAVGHLLTLLAPLPDALAGLREGTALATHERIAATARAAGFARVLLARPGIDGVAQALGAADPSIESTG